MSTALVATGGVIAEEKVLPEELVLSSVAAQEELGRALEGVFETLIESGYLVETAPKRDGKRRWMITEEGQRYFQERAVQTDAGEEGRS